MDVARSADRERDPIENVVDVSVVIITYNDEERLSRAIESASRQTLRNLEIIVVDDASTDATHQVVENLQAVDARIRYIRLSANSGGCGAPRNAGIRAARGNWIMFLDSDDYLERHACKNLLLAGERGVSDVVAGAVRRVNASSGKESPWYQRLYTSATTYEAPFDRGEWLFDSLSVNKLYRRTFLLERKIEFQEGVLYEDLLFMVRVYVELTRMAVIPEVVYYWTFVPPGSSDRTSITNSRNEMRNLVARIDAHKAIGEYLIANGEHDLLRAKQRKFILHDAMLYLGDMLWLDDATGLTFGEALSDYGSSIPTEVFERVPPLYRTLWYLLRQGDLDEVRRCTRAIVYREVAGHLHIGDSQLLWTDKYESDPNSLWWLELSQERLADLPLQSMPVAHDLVAIDLPGDEIRIAGRTWDPLGRLQGARIDLLVHRQGSDDVSVIATSGTMGDGGSCEWTAVINVRRDLPWANFSNQPLPAQRGKLLRKQSFALRVGVSRGSALPNVAPLRHARGLPLRGDDVPVSIEGFRDSALMRYAANPSMEATLRCRGLTRKRAVWRKVSSAKESARDLSSRVWATVSRRPLAVFQSNGGAGYSGSPKYIYEELLRQGIPIDVLWGYRSRKDGFPEEADLVHVESVKYESMLRQARYWCDDQGFPLRVEKRSGTVYVQTWHGTPLKLMGHDEPRSRSSGRQMDRLKRHAARWDYLVCPSDYFKDTFVRSYGTLARLIGPGTPRNDLLVTQGGAEPTWVQRALSGWEGEGLTVLYAPTLREGTRGLLMDAPWKLESFAEELPGYRLMIRSHYLNRVKIPKAVRHSVTSVSDFVDVNGPLLAADLLITDYSSVAFDYAITGRPIIFFAHDYEEYALDRGMYFDLANEAPGPVVRSEAELWEAVRTVDTWRPQYQAKYDAFQRRFCSGEDGGASARVVNEVFKS